MIKIIKSLILLTFLVLACSSQTSQKIKVVSNKNKSINETNYVIDSLHEIGDSRRYGIYPDSLNNKIHPKTGKSLITSLIDFAESNEITIKFIKGYYGLNLILDSRKNVDLYFDNAEFNLLHITNEKGERSKDINLRGSLILFDRFGTYHSDNINVDSIIIKSNPIKNLSKSKSRGCHIYKGTKDLHIKYLKVEDLASGDIKYQNNHAALAIDGLRENPVNVTIDEVYIDSSDRHGAYITGSGHVFNKMVINKYAQGSTNFMTGMQDSVKGEEKVLSGLWINRCNNCIFNEIEIHTKNSTGGIPLKLDQGIIRSPSFINYLALDVKYEDSIILDDIFTNILVKKIVEID